MDKIALTIHTCDKFSDIWDASIGLLNKNWPDRDMKTYLVTDAPSYRKFNKVSIYSAGIGLDMPMRLKQVIGEIDSEYIFFTLDDYLLTEKIDNSCIDRILDIMDKHTIDYLGFYNFSHLSSIVDESEKIMELDLNCEENYILNLYPSIWRKTFMEKTLIDVMDIWHYEVSLTKIAKDEGAFCCVACNNQFPIMDTIRKGKFLHKPYRYVMENNLYDGNREVISYFQEYKLSIMLFLKMKLPIGIFKHLKKIMKMLGYKFYSE